MKGFIATVVGTGHRPWVTALVYDEISFGPRRRDLHRS